MGQEKTKPPTPRPQPPAVRDDLGISVNPGEFYGVQQDFFNGAEGKDEQGRPTVYSPELDRNILKANAKPCAVCGWTREALLHICNDCKTYQHEDCDPPGKCATHRCEGELTETRKLITENIRTLEIKAGIMTLKALLIATIIWILIGVAQVQLDRSDTEGLLTALTIDSLWGLYAFIKIRGVIKQDNKERAKIQEPPFSVMDVIGIEPPSRY
jgi:hypothetical protein